MLFDPKWFLYTLLGLIADLLDMAIMRSSRRPELSMAPSDTDHLSDEEILERVMDAPWVGEERSVRRLTQNTVVKGSRPVLGTTDPAEAAALNLVFAKSTIPVPRVRRLVKTPESFLIVMDYIPGQTLAEAWPTLSTWQKMCIAWTLRRYIRQLRRMKVPDTTPPGPISGDVPQICESPIFGEVRFNRGPFASYAELSRFFNERHKMTADKKRVPLDDPLRNDRFDDSHGLVLVHQDLNLRNMILGEDGRLWIIDWAWSGYYPQWFEYVTMRRQHEWEMQSGTKDNFWMALIPFITGPYFRQEKWLSWMELSLDYI